MGILTIDMSSHEVEPDGTAFSGYDDEVLYAGWIGALATHQTRAERSAMPAPLATADVDVFLKTMYACQR